MSLPFLPRSLVTTTLGFEESPDTEDEDEDEDEDCTVKERKKTRLWSCREDEEEDDDDDGGGGGEREEREK